MTTKTTNLGTYRQLVFQRLKELGHPIDAWQAEHDKAQAKDPLGRRRSFSVIQAPAYGNITCLRPGFTETIPILIMAAPSHAAKPSKSTRAEPSSAESLRFEVNTSAERTAAQPDPAFRALQGDKNKSKLLLSTVTKRALKEPREALPVKDLKS